MILADLAFDVLVFYAKFFDVSVLTFRFSTFQFFDVSVFDASGAFNCVTSSTTDHEKKKCKFGENGQNEVFTFFSCKQWLEEIVAKIVVTFGNNCSC
jgi:hypothetical protein